MQLLAYLKRLCRQTPSESATELSREEIYNLLSNSRRRHIIAYLARSDGPVTRRELSEYLADIEDTNRQTCSISIYQQHLPELEKAGVIEWERDLVYPTQNCSVLRDIDSQVQSQLR